jgi:hypothetical protein
VTSYGLIPLKISARKRTRISLFPTMSVVARTFTGLLCASFPEIFKYCQLPSGLCILEKK